MTGANRATHYTLHTTRSGFTLMEMLVALALFSVVVVVATDLFFSFQRISRKTEGLQEVVSNSRAVMERIVREIREGTIDYSAYQTSMTRPRQELYLKDRTGAPLAFRYAQCAGMAMQACLTFSRGSAQPERLTDEVVSLRSVQFAVAPGQDPFEFDMTSGQYASNAQPRVTITLSLDNGLMQSDERYVRYDAQTTVSSRSYRR